METTQEQVAPAAPTGDEPADEPQQVVSGMEAIGEQSKSAEPADVPPQVVPTNEAADEIVPAVEPPVLNPTPTKATLEFRVTANGQSVTGRFVDESAAISQFVLLHGEIGPMPPQVECLTDPRIPSVFAE